MSELTRTSRELPDGNGAMRQDVGLKTLLGRLNNDASQLVHDELELAKLELRDVANALSSDVREAGQTLVKDLAKVGIALSLALMAGLALTAGAVIGIGRLLGGEYWAGGFIAGIVLLIAAVMAFMSAANSTKGSDALRLENTRRTLKQDAQVLASEARETKEFVQEEAQAFKRHATASNAA